MKIDVLCSDGSPIGVCPQCLWGDTFRVGLGGAEYALITMCEEWTKAGHELRLYNSPHAVSDKIDQRPQTAFDLTENRDILITFRSPNAYSIPAKGMKVWWSTDQYTQGDFRTFAPLMDKIVCISPFHQHYFKEIYGIDNTIHIDLPVRVDEIPDEPKIPSRFIFTSVPDRGLLNLRRMYPKLYAKNPNISLVITSDYRLWGASQMNEQHRASWIDCSGLKVSFRGALSRKDYLSELAKAEIMLYPCTYDELFCISVAEAQCAGVYTITSDYGALETTNMGVICKDNPNNPAMDECYVNACIENMDSPAFNGRRIQLMNKARERFAVKNILKQWDEKVFK